MGEVVRIDGRTLRREENRSSVLEALGELYREGNYDPSVSEIAARAGLSPRSLFRYFDDVDDLNRAAIEHMINNARPLLDVAVDDSMSTAEKIERVVSARLRLFDAIAPAARAVRIGAPRHDILARQLRQSRTFWRLQVEGAFGIEGTLLDTVDVLLQFETYELLPRNRAAVVLTDALTTLLENR